MDIQEAIKLAEQVYPNMGVFGAAQNDVAWIFGLDFKTAGNHPSEVGLPQVAVDKQDGSIHQLTPGTDAFWRYMTPDTEEVPLPSLD